MTTQTEALRVARDAMNAMLTYMGMDEDEWNKGTFNQMRKAITNIEEALAQPEQSTTCWEPVAWRYKPVREDNQRWEYTTNHPLDMGDGYLRPSLVEYCKCIEPLYAKEKPKLMLEKFREMKDLLDDTTPPQLKEPEQEPVATIRVIAENKYGAKDWEFSGVNTFYDLPFGEHHIYLAPPQRKPLTNAEIRKWWASENGFEDCNMAKLDDFEQVIRAVEGKHGIKEST